MVRVRVLGSKNRLTTVFPRSKGTFLISRLPKLIKLLARSRIRVRFSLVWFEVDKKCFNWPSAVVSMELLAVELFMYQKSA